jgi:hypothetical protein
MRNCDVRFHELLEVEPDYNILRKRLDQRVTDLWNEAANDAASVIAEALRLQEWLRTQTMTGEADRIRRQVIAELSELIRFLRS